MRIRNTAFSMYRTFAFHVRVSPCLGFLGNGVDPPAVLLLLDERVAARAEEAHGVVHARVQVLCQLVQAHQLPHALHTCRTVTPLYFLSFTKKKCFLATKNPSFWFVSRQLVPRGYSTFKNFTCYYARWSTGKQCCGSGSESFWEAEYGSASKWKTGSGSASKLKAESGSGSACNWKGGSLRG